MVDLAHQLVAVGVVVEVGRRGNRGLGKHTVVIRNLAAAVILGRGLPGVISVVVHHLIELFAFEWFYEVL